jgi:hypothetical protein
MSTGLECLFLERKKGEWYYILEHWDSPKGAFDWLDYATTYGPFKNKKGATEDLDFNHSNPGGWHVIDLEHYQAFSDNQKEKYEDLIKHPSCPVTPFKFGI